MSTRGYRRVGLLRRENGRWKNFCDIHFRYHQRFEKSMAYLGGNNRSINHITRHNTKHIEKMSNALSNDAPMPSHEIDKGAVGIFYREDTNGEQCWKCLFTGFITYEGTPYHDLEIRLFGNFFKEGEQAAELRGHVAQGAHAPLPWIPLLRKGELKWRVETKRRLSRRQVNRLRG